MCKRVRLFFKFILVIFPLFAFTQKEFTLSGYIMNINNNELIIGANIVIPENNIGVISNSYGFYSITVPKGSYEIEF